MTKNKKVAIQAAKKAGDYLLKNFEKKDKVKFKSKHEIATMADFAAEKIILKEIKRNFPSHAILSEESGGNKKNSDYLWVVDPLDGTTNYYMKNPLFSVSISLFYKEEIVLGVIHAPYLNELYTTEKDKGAYLNSKKIHASNKKSLSKSILTFCHGTKEKDIKRAIKTYNHFKLKGFDMRQLGSAALELGFVAAGRTESIMIPGAHPWDVGAGVLLVREASGRVTDYKEEEWKLKSKDMLASNGKIHNELLKTLNKIL